MVKCVAKVVCFVGVVSWGCFAAINTEGQKGVVRTFSAKTLGRATMDIGLGLNYAQDSEFMQNVRKVTASGDSLIGEGSARLLNGTVHIGLGTASFLDFAASLPFYYDRAGIDGIDRDGGIGDLSLSTKFLYPPPGKRRVFYQSYYLGFTIPTGNSRSGVFPRHTFYYNEADTSGSDANYPMKGRFYTPECGTFKPLMLWTFDIGSVVKKFQFQIDVNLGGVFSFDGERQNLVLANIALEYEPVEVLSIFVDFAGKSRWDNFETKFRVGTDPLMLSPGIRLNTPVGLYVSFAGDFALFRDAQEEKWEPDHGDMDDWKYYTYVYPKYGFQFLMGWKGYLTPQDKDKDGLKDDDDRCPKDPEDLDRFEDNDGCPDPDNDKDGVEDARDKCPNKAEDRDGFEDDDGCPDADNDGDGITDLQDRCPKIPEDFDGIEDEDGCPDYDNDKDGVADSTDKCMNDPEDVDGFEDNDGCPDPDNDKDGIPDLKDKCPNKPESMNGIDDEDGCPDEKPKKKKQSSMPKHQILEGVNFASGSSNMTYSSYQYLEPIVKEMKAYPEIEIEVRGHTDSVGRYQSNMRLSQKRAESVKMYLVKQGIASNRIRAVGFGPSSPVADNRTAAGRAKNRRIEIVRVK